MDSEATKNRLATVQSLLWKTNKDILSCSSQTATNARRVTNKTLKYRPLVHLRFSLNAGKAVLMYYSKEVAQVIPIVSDLRRN